MAEAPDVTDSVSDRKGKNDNMECAVCLQKCVYPAQLPCGHIFCFLCVKGFANQNKKCAMCRQEIPRDFIEQPKLLEPVAPDKTETFDNGFQWFYEGRNGWWQYDERTSKDLELSYKNNEKTTELLIAGFLYIIDLENMLQIRRNDPSRRRRIKRDFTSVAIKGVAGIPQIKEIPINEEASVESSGVNTTVASLQASESVATEEPDEANFTIALQRLANMYLE